MSDHTNEKTLRQLQMVEDIKKEAEVSERSTEKFFGFLLLIPAIISTILFFYTLIFGVNTLTHFKDSNEWTGTYGYSGEGGGGGYTSALPFYFGLLAIAVAYLVKNKKK